MGQTYSVYIKLRFRDEEGAKKALVDKIARAERENVSYDIEGLEVKHQFDLTNTLDLLSVFFCGWGDRLQRNTTDPGVLHSGFDASYGWEKVMMDAFDEIAEYLYNGSWIRIYPDSGKDLAIVRGGRAVWLT